MQGSYLKNSFSQTKQKTANKEASLTLLLPGIHLIINTTIFTECALMNVEINTIDNHKRGKTSQYKIDMSSSQHNPVGGFDEMMYQSLEMGTENQNPIPKVSIKSGNIYSFAIKRQRSTNNQVDMYTHVNISAD